MTSKSYWSPQLEAKLQAWHRLQQLADQTRPAPCFTIAREFGCQAYPVAEKLSQRLNAQTAGDPWVVVGRELLDEVARLSGYKVEQIEKSQDTPASLKAIFSMFLDSSRAEETEVFTHLRKVVREFAKRGNCILVGGGAVFATQDLPNCIHVRLVAPYVFRLQKVMRTHQLSEAAAHEYIERHQKQRDDFIRRFADGQDDHPALYHLIINNGRMNIDDMAATIDELLVLSGN
jgi:cytidylate kinase